MRHNPGATRRAELRATAARATAAVQKDEAAVIAAASPDLRPSPWGIGILLGLRNKPVWQGDAKHNVDQTRARNRAARRTRKAQRAK